MNSDASASFAIIEEWLRTTVGQRIDHEHSAKAMIDDGHPEACSQVLAAMALLRHSPLSLHELLASGEGQRAMRCMSRYLDRSLDELYTGPDQSPAIFDPTRLQGHSIQLSDREVEVQMVAHHPPTALLAGLLSGEECDALIALGVDSLDADTVVDPESGETRRTDSSRSSYGTFAEFSETPLLQRVGKRVAELVGVDNSRHEMVALTRYRPGEQFVPHHDYFWSMNPSYAERIRNGGQRIATMVIYLNDVEAGGATQLPLLNVDIRPRRGSALYFSYQRRDGSPDASSLHAGAPVIAGEKWIATLWFREREWVRGLDDDGASESEASNAVRLPA